MILRFAGDLLVVAEFINQGRIWPHSDMNFMPTTNQSVDEVHEVSLAAAQRIG